MKVSGKVSEESRSVQNALFYQNQFKVLMLLDYSPSMFSLDLDSAELYFHWVWETVKILFKNLYLEMDDFDEITQENFKYSPTCFVTLLAVGIQDE